MTHTSKAPYPTRLNGQPRFSVELNTREAFIECPADISFYNDRCEIDEAWIGGLKLTRDQLVAATSEAEICAQEERYFENHYNAPEDMAA